ncbi:hypothetical protein RhiirC2_780702 [Rhizophagus irregularis]|uniref:Uncharacterized protein n=1 Tax=Rhizophagus irregularis TaxID=588596 RepID=A0A2N1N762_9GLOM|nr:hypothetical protein RhiirC2_780702 [Rhizophagus irregularis]
MNSPNRPSTSLNIDVNYSGTSIQTNPAIADIQTFLLGDSNTINKLLSLTDLLSSRQNLNFYIDDALRPPGLTSNNLNTHKTTNMGFGWIDIDRTDNNPLYTFYGSTILTPSSTKAESFAILTAILAQVLKIPNHQIWRVIKHLVDKKSINLSLHKVKAHSDVTYNDLADAEATKGLDASPIIINSKSTMIPLWDSIGPIDRDLRKFCHNIIDAITYQMSHLDAATLLQPIVDETHPIYLIVHNIVPQSLIDLIHPHTRKFSYTNSIVMDVMLLVQNQFYTIVWKRHTESMTAWEKRQGIHTKKSKMRRANRRALNKRKNAHKNSQPLISQPLQSANVASLEHVISRIDMTIV